VNHLERTQETLNTEMKVTNKTTTMKRKTLISQVPYIMEVAVTKSSKVVQKREAQRNLPLSRKGTPQVAVERVQDFNNTISHLENKESKVTLEKAREVVTLQEEAAVEEIHKIKEIIKTTSKQMITTITSIWVVVLENPKENTERITIMIISTVLVKSYFLLVAREAILTCKIQFQLSISVFLKLL
jgi:hypothetical protein